MKRKLEEELITWKKRENRSPILLRGARQVGKSYLVEHFGKEHFDSFALVDFENRPELKKAFISREPKQILSTLELSINQPIKEGKTLLFLDEIQACPEALRALRYFKEQMPKLHVIAAGSLLEFLLKDDEFSFPVGRVEFLYLHPLSFLEYLESSHIGAERVGTYSLDHRPNPLEHEEMLKWVKRYMFVGGMPAAVTSAKESLLSSQRIHHQLLQAYENDFGKYAKETHHKYLRTIFQKAPALIAQILKYRRIDEEVRSRDLKPALDLLCHAGLLQRVFATTASGLPLHAHQKDDRFKLLYLDTGLLQTATQVDATLFFERDILQINAGMLAEQFVGQELISYAPPYQNAPLLFWERSGGKAEVDFVTTIGGQIVPIEVKAGTQGTLRSLGSFLQEKRVPLGVRISETPLSLHGQILSVPFYLISQLERLVALALLKRS